MKILILGAGLMGPAAAFNALSDPQVSQVIICDNNQQSLQSGIARLAGKQGSEKLGVVRLDLTKQAAAADLMRNFDAVVSALPKSASLPVSKAALQAKTPLIDLTMPPAPDAIAELEQLAQSAGGLIVLACGLEPGLTEIMARHLAQSLDQVDELHIKCGGIPANPTPPLGYKIVFGGDQLPLREQDAQQVTNGKLEPVPRYSGVEVVTFAGVGRCEAWHEGFMPWLLDVPAFQNLKHGTQKTVRWPGYAAKVTVLKEMGLLSQQPIQVDGVAVIPKKLLDTVLYPRVKLNEKEHDITLFQVAVHGQKKGRPCRYQADMIDRYDDTLHITSMARTTAFTGAIVARMIGRGDLEGRGVFHPEQLVIDRHFNRLVEELADNGIKFRITQQ